MYKKFLSFITLQERAIIGSHINSKSKIYAELSYKWIIERTNKKKEEKTRESNWYKKEMAQRHENYINNLQFYDVMKERISKPWQKSEEKKELKEIKIKDDTIKGVLLAKWYDKNKSEKKSDLVIKSRSEMGWVLEDLKKKEKENKYLEKIKEKEEIEGLFSFLRRDRKRKTTKKYIYYNIERERRRSIRSKILSNKIITPHYFFTEKYNLKAMPSQIKSWSSSVYLFFKPEERRIYYLDLQTSKLLKLFFTIKNIKYINNDHVNSLFGHRLAPLKSITETISGLVKYTSLRSTSYLKELIALPSVVLTSEWVMGQIASAKATRKRLSERMGQFRGGFLPKERVYQFKEYRAMIGKPLFKHTPYNIIIDLFIFNNKRNQFKRFGNMLSRRILYKYMYSMYVDYSIKARESLSRPRFFYLNLIEPNIAKYYKIIIERYQEYLISKQKGVLIYFCMELLKWNNNRKNSQSNLNLLGLNVKNKILNKMNNSDKSLINNSTISNKIVESNLKNKVVLLEDSSNNMEEENKEVVYLEEKIVKRIYKVIEKNAFSFGLILNRIRKNELRDYIYEKDGIAKLHLFTKNKIVWEGPSLIIVIKKRKKKRKIYKEDKKRLLSSLERQILEHKKLRQKWDQPLKELTLWDRTGLNKEVIEKPWEKVKKKKNYDKNKYSLNEYKRKIYYAAGKIKRKLAPELWEEKIKAFNLSTKWQKDPEKATPVEEPGVIIKDNQGKEKKPDILPDNKKVWWSDEDFSKIIKEDKKRRKKIKKLLGMPLGPTDKQKKNILIKMERERVLQLITKKQEKKTLILKGKNKVNSDDNIVPSQFNRVKYLNNIIKSQDKKEDIFNNRLYKNFYYLISKKKVYIKIKNKAQIQLNNKNNNNINLKTKKNKSQEIFNTINISDNINNIKNHLLFNLPSLLVNKISYNLPNWNRKYLQNYTEVNWRKLKTNSEKGISSVLTMKKKNNNIKDNKVLWDNLDNSIMRILSKIFKFNKEEKLGFSSLSFDNVLNYIMSVVNSNKYDLGKYYTGIMMKEYLIVVKDILQVSGRIPTMKEVNININKYGNKDEKLRNYFLPYGLNMEGKKNNRRYWWNDEYKNMDKSDYINVNSGIVNVWNMGTLIKPYYRAMMSIYMIRRYKKFMRTLGFRLFYSLITNKLIRKINIFRIMHISLSHHLYVKTLFDMLKYNYRSLIRMNVKYYDINKLKLNERKWIRLNINTWFTSIKYLRRLRRTPNNFWLRYHKLASHYFKRIVFYSQRETKRKILLPFVFYIEDILYMIYGKWGIIRLWPIKRYFLNSYILVQRLQGIINHRNNSQNFKTTFGRVTRQLMSRYTIGKISRSYKYYSEEDREIVIGNKNRWPKYLLEFMKEKNQKKTHLNIQSLNYSFFEYFMPKFEKNELLGTYNIPANDIGIILSNVNDHLRPAMWNYWEQVSKGGGKLPRDENWLYTTYRQDEMYRNDIFYPINNYISQMKERYDIEGMRIKIGGRTGIRRSNMRKLTRNVVYGNLLGPKHYNWLTKKEISLYNPILRNFHKSNIEFARQVTVNRNGCLTLKVWMSSLMGSDIHELFVHLIRIKDVYNQIISRYYLVSPGFKEKALIDKFITLNKYKNFKKSIKRKYQTYHIYRRPQLNPYLKLKVKDMRENELLTLKRKKYKNSIKELERDAKIFNNIIKDFKESKDLNERLANIFLWRARLKVIINNINKLKSNKRLNSANIILINNRSNNLSSINTKHSLYLPKNKIQSKKDINFNKSYYNKMNNDILLDNKFINKFNLRKNKTNQTNYTKKKNNLKNNWKIDNSDKLNSKNNNNNTIKNNKFNKWSLFKNKENKRK